MARDLRKAKDIRDLIDRVVSARRADPDEIECVGKWAAWANEVADRTDPLLRLEFDPEGAASLIDIELRLPPD